MSRIVVLLTHLGCLSGLVGGCTGFGGRAESQLLSGYAAYRAGDNSAALQSADALLRSGRHSSLQGEAHYLRGLARERLGDRTGAEADYRRACDVARTREVRAHALLARADVAWAAGDLPKAENLYRQCLAESRAGQPIHEEALRRMNRLHGRAPSLLAAKPNRASRAPDRRSRPSGSSSAWVVQAGAFSREGNAQALVSRLAAGGLPARREPAARGEGRTLHIVRVGPYDSYEGATAALRDIRQFQSQAFIRTVR